MHPRCRPPLSLSRRMTPWGCVGSNLTVSTAGGRIRLNRELGTHAALMLRLGPSLPLGRDDAVTLAGACLEDPAVDDFDLTARPLDRTRCFQGSECLGDAGTIKKQNHRKLV